MATALIGFAALLALCFLGFRVGFATLIVGFVGFAFQRIVETVSSRTPGRLLDLQSHAGNAEGLCAEFVFTHYAPENNEFFLRRKHALRTAKPLLNI